MRKTAAAQRLLIRARTQAEPMERVRLVLAAMARGDERETQALWHACPRSLYSMPRAEFADLMEGLALAARSVEGLMAGLRVALETLELASLVAVCVSCRSLEAGALAALDALAATDALGPDPCAALEAPLASDDFGEALAAAIEREGARSLKLLTALRDQRAGIAAREAALWAASDDFAAELGVAPDVFAAALLDGVQRPESLPEPEPEFRAAALALWRRHAPGLGLAASESRDVLGDRATAGEVPGSQEEVEAG